MLKNIIPAVLSTAALFAVAPAHAHAEAPPVRMRNLDLRAKWFPTQDRLLYRVEDAEGRASFMVLDAEKAEQTPLLSPSIIDAAGKQGIASPEIEFAIPAEDGRVAVKFKGNAATWMISTTGTLDQAAAGAANPFSAKLLPGDVRTRGAGPSTSFTVINSTAEPLKLDWIDDGGGVHNYGEVKPGESRQQHTYTNHAWRLVRPDGTVLGGFYGAETPQTLIVDSLDPVINALPPRRRRRENPETPKPAGRINFADHNATLIRQDGSKLVLTTDGTAKQPYTGPADWSPDGSRVVITRRNIVEKRKVTLVESSPKDQLQPKTRTIEYVKPGDEIDTESPCLFDAETGKPLQIDSSLFATPWDLSRLRWRADSSGFTFLYNQRGHQVMRMIEVSRDGSPRALVNEECRTFFDYAAKTYAEFVDEDLLWMSERSGWNHLYLYSRDGTCKPVTSGEWVVKRVQRVDSSRSPAQVWFWAVGIRPGQDPYHEHYCRVNLDGTSLTILTEGDGTHTVMPDSFSPSGGFFIDRYSRVDLPPITEVRRAADGTLVAPLARGEAPSDRLPERFSAKGRDGKTDIWGIIQRPRNFDPAKKYPVIEQIYAGPHDQHVPKAYRGSYDRANEFCERGFVVVMIDGMGTNWRSKAFHDVAWKNLADAGFPDRIAWMKAAANTRPWMDLDNGGRGVGIYGGSAGGQNAMRALIGHHDFYKVAAADCGCHDNRMDKIWWNELWMSWPVGPHYEASSNVVHAGELEGHLLLTVGELDENVDPASTLQVVNALIKAGKSFDYLMVPGAGHGAGESPFASAKRREFFERHLKAAPAR